MKNARIVRLAPMLVLLAVFPGNAPAEVILGGDIVVEAGKTVDSAVSFGGKVVVFGTVSDDAVSFGEDVIIEKGGLVKGNAVSLGGTVTVNDSASVGKDAVSVGGTVFQAPTGVIGGERIMKSTGAFSHVKGTCGNVRDGILRIVLFGPLAGFFGSLGVVLMLVFFVMRLLLWLAFALLIQYFFQDNVAVMGDSLRRKFGISVLYGALFLFILPFSFLFLIVSLIGIPLIPLAAFTLLLLYLFGSTGVAMWAGQLIPNAAGRSGAVNVALGVLCISLLRLIPGVGFLVCLLLAAVSAGVVIITRLGTRSHEISV